MNKQFINVLFILAICFVAYMLFRNLNFKMKEGMTTDPSGNLISSAVASSGSTTGSTSASTSSSSGIAGGAQTYAANIKSMVIKNQDVLLISKYRNDYENAILNLDDLINTMMLQTALSVSSTSPTSSLETLVQLNSARSALNNVMKFLDMSQ
jgi:hypothetical protein